jgi:hypothetical protein
MDVIKILRAEYPGEEAWQAYVHSFRPAWAQLSNQQAYLRTFGDEDLAIVLFGQMADHALTWFDRPCPALEGRVPSAILRDDVAGVEVIRSVLMRVPY